MWNKWTMAATVAVGMAFLPGTAPAESASSDEVAELRDLVLQLQDQVRAQSEEMEGQKEQIESQEKLIGKMDLDSSAASGMAGWWNSVDVSGWVAARYNYNFNRPDQRNLGGVNTGGGISNPFNPDANSFSMDQFWITIDKPVSEESRAGFYAEIGFGKTADILNGRMISFTDDNDDDGSFYNFNQVYHQAYIQYLAPIANGVTVVAGKFGTYIGAEVAQAPFNLNITRGLVYQSFQPIDHTGVKFEGTVGDSIDWGFGVVDGFGFNNDATDDFDINDGKSLLWHVGWTGDKFGLGVNGIWGAEDAGTSGPKRYLLDIVGTWNPCEEFEAWMNIDYLRQGMSHGDDAAAGWGIATAGRYAVTDRLGVAGRVEYIKEAPDWLGLGGRGDAYSLTGTTDYALTENLTLRGELRWDDVGISKAPDNYFVGDGYDVANSTNDYDKGTQLLGLLELILTF